MKTAGTADSRELFREKRRDFKRLASDRFYAYLTGLIDDLNSNPKRFWSFAKCIKGKTGQMSHLYDGDMKVTDDLQKAELLNRTFASKFSDTTVTELPPTPAYQLDPLLSFHVGEGAVLHVLRSLSPHKACGPDNLSARVIRECAVELSVPITKICKLSLDQGVFPRAWKRANIVPIYKKGSKTCATNYRSVSLLPLLSKVLERIVFTELFHHVQTVISEQQHGFIPGRSCATNLCTMLHEAWTNISAGSQTDIIYTDYSSAFQSVNHRLLLHKLERSYQISGKALDWIRSYLSGREQRVVVHGKCSKWVRVRSGTPEGGLLSPLLFACFMNDLPESIRTEMLMFADDVKLYGRVDSVTDVNFIQAQLDNLCEWSDRWMLKLNPDKCKVLTLTLRRNPVVGVYAIKGVALERVQVMRDLGILLDQRLTFGEHVEHTVRKANRALGMLMRTFATGKRGRSFDMSNHRAILSTYFANVRSILEYGSVVWSGAARSHIQRIERVQEKFLVWLCARCRAREVSFTYRDLTEYFNVNTLAARYEQHDIMFIRNVHRNKVRSPFLLEKFPISVPTRQLRAQSLFAVSFARVNTVRMCTFNRIPNVCNAFLNANRDVDVWNSSLVEFRARVRRYVRGR